jgi:hypothetical protein
MAFDITPLKPGSMVALFSLSLALSRMGGGNGLAFNSLVFVIQVKLSNIKSTLRTSGCYHLQSFNNTGQFSDKTSLRIEYGSLGTGSHGQNKPLIEKESHCVDHTAMI